MTARIAAFAPPLGFRSAGRTDAGAVRKNNEDAFLDRPCACLWAVADGMGGHRDGEAASALTIDHLARLGRFDSGYAYLGAVEAALLQANCALAARADQGVTGATVVTLLIHDAHAACLWAGDSRAYRLSGGVLDCMTRDHTLVQALRDAGAAPHDNRRNVVTRAVGAAEQLQLDRAFAPVLPGDRFLLCSDGLTGVLTDGDIARLLAQGDIPDCADALMAAALVAGAPDNVTLVTIEAQAAL